MFHGIRDKDYSTGQKDYYERLNETSYELKMSVLLIPLDLASEVLRLDFHRPTTPRGASYAIEANYIVTRP